MPAPLQDCKPASNIDRSALTGVQHRPGEFPEPPNSSSKIRRFSLVNFGRRDLVNLARRFTRRCCFSNYKQLFAVGQQFTYSIEHIARYYRSYVELMEHWNAVLPGKILRVQHESVVDDLEGNVRRILAFCGVKFEDSCVTFYKTERCVNTASSE